MARSSDLDPDVSEALRQINGSSNELLEAAGSEALPADSLEQKSLEGADPQAQAEASTSITKKGKASKQLDLAEAGQDLFDSNEVLPKFAQAMSIEELKKYLAKAQNRDGVDPELREQLDTAEANFQAIIKDLPVAESAPTYKEDSILNLLEGSPEEDPSFKLLRQFAAVNGGPVVSSTIPTGASIGGGTFDTSLPSSEALDYEAPTEL